MIVLDIYKKCKRPPSVSIRTPASVKYPDASIGVFDPRGRSTFHSGRC